MDYQNNNQKRPRGRPNGTTGRRWSDASVRELRRAAAGSRALVAAQRAVLAQADALAAAEDPRGWLIRELLRDSMSKLPPVRTKSLELLGRIWGVLDGPVERGGQTFQPLTIVAGGDSHNDINSNESINSQNDNSSEVVGMNSTSSEVIPL